MAFAPVIPTAAAPSAFHRPSPLSSFLPPGATSVSSAAQAPATGSSLMSLRPPSLVRQISTPGRLQQSAMHAEFSALASPASAASGSAVTTGDRSGPCSQPQSGTLQPSSRHDCRQTQQKESWRAYLTIEERKCVRDRMKHAYKKVCPDMESLLETVASIEEELLAFMSTDDVQYHKGAADYATKVQLKHRSLHPGMPRTAPTPVAKTETVTATGDTTATVKTSPPRVYSSVRTAHGSDTGSAFSSPFLSASNSIQTLLSPTSLLSSPFRNLFQSVLSPSSAISPGLHVPGRPPRTVTGAVATPLLSSPVSALSGSAGSRHRTPPQTPSTVPGRVGSIPTKTSLQLPIVKEDTDTSDDAIRQPEGEGGAKRQRKPGTPKAGTPKASAPGPGSNPSSDQELDKSIASRRTKRSTAGMRRTTEWEEESMDDQRSTGRRTPKRRKSDEEERERKSREKLDWFVQIALSEQQGNSTDMA